MKKVELNEPKMENGERMFKGYTYVVHLAVSESVYVAKETMKVSEFKIANPAVFDVHKCDMVGRCIAVKKVTRVRK